MSPAPDSRLAEAPPAVVIRFSERVEARPSSLEVLDARGRRVDRGDAATEPADPWRYRVSVAPLALGAYTVSWRVLSADDGHVTHGAYVFTVGEAVATTPDPGPAGGSGRGWRPLARWMVTTGGALLLGAIVAAPRLGIGATRSSAAMEVLGGAAMAVGGTLDLVLQARELAGPRPLAGVLATLLVTQSGRVWLVRAGLLLAMTATVIRRRPRGRSGDGRWWLRAGLAAAVVMAGALVSHGAAAVEGRWLILGAEALHLLAVAAWVGGLQGFATAFWRAGVAFPPREAARVALAIPAFSGLAALAVGVLSLSGFVLARIHLTAWDELVGTAYGRWLAAKLAVFGVMLALGGWHQWRTAPSLLRALERGEPAPTSVPRFRRSIRVEAALGLAALALAGVLGVTAPPAPRAALPGFTHERALAAARVRLEIAPLRPGPNTVRLTVTDLSGRALDDATAAMVQVAPVDASVGPITFQLDRTGPGEFAAPAAVLGLVGRWSGRLVVQRSGAYDVNDRFDVVVAEPTAAHAHGEAAKAVRPAMPLDRVTAGVAVATAAVTLGLSLRSRSRLRAVRRLLGDPPEPPAAEPAPR
jgi:copper transport protein